MRVVSAAELRTLRECQYRYPGETMSDLQQVRARFNDLRLYVDFYCFPNKEKKKLVYLAGTLPVHIQGSDYNIPVCIWLHETHPLSRPRCFVVPSVSMVINPSCSCVDASGNIRLHALNTWTHGVSNLSLLVSEMRRAFQEDTPLYARCPVLAPPPAGVQVSPSAGSIRHPDSSSNSISSSSNSSSNSISSSSNSSSSISSPPPPWSHHPSLTSSHLSGQKASQWEPSREGRRSYMEELLGIDFSAPPPPSSSSNPFLSSSGVPVSAGVPVSVPVSAGVPVSVGVPVSAGVPVSVPVSVGVPVSAGVQVSAGVPVSAGVLSRMVDALRLDAQSAGQTVQSEAAREGQMTGSGPELHQDLGTGSGADHIKMATRLPPHQAAIFLSLVTMEGRGFSPGDVMEAVQLSSDFPSALKFLTHSCPICQEQVTFSKIITMTHCSCFLCQTCFKTFFSAAIKEKSIDQLSCPQCGQPEVKGQGAMDYFNLLDTQIRHFLPPHIHELFQRKLRDRALQDMPNFCWCSHCSFGMLHEAERLRMDCPSCKKSTCSQCRSPWSPEHQGVSCQQFRVLQQQNQPDLQNLSLLSCNSIACPQCASVFSLSRGGCLHFTCSQCQHQFCGGCRNTFTTGAVCVFSADCVSKGLHAHHPRDCLYHLRDWSVSRLLLLLQYYRVSPAWMEPANSSSALSQTVCLVSELREDGRDEACGRAAQHSGYCQSHFKECLVELVHRCRGDPAVLFSPVEMKAELRRWNVAVPTRKPEEPEQVYERRLRLALTNSVPLRKQQPSPGAPPPAAH